MRLAIKGNGTTYYATYVKNAHSDNRGIGLLSSGNTIGDIDYVAYLWPDDNGGNKLVIDMDQVKNQGLHLLVKENGKERAIKGGETI